MSLASLIDKPLIQNPLAGGSQLGGLTFRQEGDMGRYVADNDPGGIAAGFSNLEDFLAAGNKLPELKDPFSNITAPGQIPDRYKEGFVEFYKQNPDDFMRIGGQAISYVTTPQGETVQFGDTSGATNFRRYLESIGETPRDDSLTTNPMFQDVPKANRTPGLPPPTDPVGIQDPIRNVDETNPYQMAGFGDQFSTLGDRLTKVEEGIANLLQNREQQFNYGMQPRFNFNTQPRFGRRGLGYFFNPIGGFYV